MVPRKSGREACELQVRGPTNILTVEEKSSVQEHPLKIH